MSQLRQNSFGDSSMSTGNASLNMSVPSLAKNQSLDTLIDDGFEHIGDNMLDYLKKYEK